MHFWLIHGIGALVSGAIAHQQNCDFLLKRKCWDWAAPNPQICAGPVKSTEFFFQSRAEYTDTTYGRYLHKKRDKFFTKKFGDLQVKSFDPFWVSPSVVRRLRCHSARHSSTRTLAVAARTDILWKCEKNMNNKRRRKLQNEKKNQKILTFVHDIPIYVNVKLLLKLKYYFFLDVPSQGSYHYISNYDFNQTNTKWF